MADAPTLTATIKGDSPSIESGTSQAVESLAVAQRTVEETRAFIDSLSKTFRSIVDRNRDVVLRSAGALHRSEPEHISSVTVALGCTLVLDVIGVHPDRAEPVTLSLRAEGGTAIGVPTVAVDQLRAAGLVL